MISIISCKKLNINRELRIDIGTSFINDAVSIELDGEMIYRSSVTTDSISGVGDIIGSVYPIGSYDLTIDVNGIEKKKKIRHKEGRYIYVSFNRSSSEISIDYSDY